MDRELSWRKSSRSSAQGANCFEWAKLPDGGAAVRNSRDPLGPVVAGTPGEIAAFILGVKDGEFDYLMEIA
ncbi:DUF397 domain-containing protein [Nonomuraea sp. NPDC050536]|uniref:DUF397 domain-containing protein n=1 Tax=Nonomuraea sp. NPDC050536 TaxID=3364366 RepID=UPI0037CCA220